MPALNEEASIGLVLDDLPSFIDEIIVGDNGSTDRTSEIATSKGATVVTENNRGYGAACLKAISDVNPDTDILLFIDADYSDFPEESENILLPIVDQNTDLVIGSRMLSKESRAALTPVAIFGNWLSTRLIRLFWNKSFTDLGPFRAIKYDCYKMLEMSDQNFGWTVEMQIKAARLNLATTEVAVSYRPRIGKSKISGTIIGSFKAGSKIIYIILRELFR